MPIELEVPTPRYELESRPRYLGARNGQYWGVRDTKTNRFAGFGSAAESQAAQWTDMLNKREAYPHDLYWDKA